MENNYKEIREVADALLERAKQWRGYELGVNTQPIPTSDPIQNVFDDIRNFEIKRPVCLNETDGLEPIVEILERSEE